MGKIFCLMGKSSSGKDTIFNKLKSDKDLDLNVIVPYTTRPKRNNEIDGVTYYFVDKSVLDRYEESGKMIEKRIYNTIKGDWNNCSIDDGNIDINKNQYIIITTLEAYVNLQRYFGKDKIIPLYINVDDGIRLERALERERMKESPNYDELGRRFVADSKDFSSERLKECEIEKYYNNIDLNQCILQIKNDILKKIN